MKLNQVTRKNSTLILIAIALQLFMLSLAFAEDEVLIKKPSHYEFAGDTPVNSFDSMVNDCFKRHIKPDEINRTIVIRIVNRFIDGSSGVEPIIRCTELTAAYFGVIYGY